MTDYKAYIYSDFYRQWTFSYPITNLTFTAEVRDGARNLIATITCTKTGTYTLELFIAKATLASLTPGFYSWDIKQTSSSLTGGTILTSGCFEITKAQTES